MEAFLIMAKLTFRDFNSLVEQKIIHVDFDAMSDKFKITYDQMDQLENDFVMVVVEEDGAFEVELTPLSTNGIDEAITGKMLKGNTIREFEEILKKATADKKSQISAVV